MIRGRTAVPGPASAGDPYVPRRGSAAFSVERYELDLSYRVASNRLTGRARIQAVAREDLVRCSLDLGGALRVTKAKAGTGAARWVHRLGKLHVTLPKPVAAGAAFLVEVTYEGNPRPLTGTWGVIGWEELDDGVIVASQPDGASSWFPCNDHPSDKAPYAIAIEVESAYEVVANGRLVRTKRGASTTRWEFDQPEPMAAYLATVQIGRYRSVELDDEPVAIRALAPVERHQAVASDLAAQAAMVEVFEGCFGRYPFAAGYSVVVTADPLEIPLEAQGLSVFGANHLDGTGHEERLVAHELAHQWFGNALTVAAWQHIWLQEGFACYAEWLWSEGSGGPSAATLAAEHHAGLAAQPQDLLLADPGADLMFDDRVYKRGALVLHALRTAIGDDAFFTLLRSWVSDHLHGSVTTDAFLQHVASAAGEATATALHPWLFDEALPPLP